MGTYKRTFGRAKARQVSLGDVFCVLCCVLCVACANPISFHPILWKGAFIDVLSCFIVVKQKKTN